MPARRPPSGGDSKEEGVAQSPIAVFSPLSPPLSHPLPHAVSFFPPPPGPPSPNHQRSPPQVLPCRRPTCLTETLLSPTLRRPFIGPSIYLLPSAQPFFDNAAAYGLHSLQVCSPSSLAFPHQEADRPNPVGKAHRGVIQSFPPAAKISMLSRRGTPPPLPKRVSRPAGWHGGWWDGRTGGGGPCLTLVALESSAAARPLELLGWWWGLGRWRQEPKKGYRRRKIKPANERWPGTQCLFGRWVTMMMMMMRQRTFLAPITGRHQTSSPVPRTRKPLCVVPREAAPAGVPACRAQHHAGRWWFGPPTPSTALLRNAAH